jgi:hypothetical protein
VRVQLRLRRATGEQRTPDQQSRPARLSAGRQAEASAGARPRWSSSKISKDAYPLVAYYGPNPLPLGFRKPWGARHRLDGLTAKPVHKCGNEHRCSRNHQTVRNAHPELIATLSFHSGTSRISPPCGAMGSTHVQAFPCEILSWGAGAANVIPHPRTGALRYRSRRDCQVQNLALTDKAQALSVGCFAVAGR